MGSLQNEASLRQAERDLAGATVFGLGFRKKSNADHNVAVRLGPDQRWRVFDSMHPRPLRLNAATALEALKETLEPRALHHPLQGQAFEYLVEKPETSPS